jgi:thermostable 8-oxoguanine DNA glycosylase
MEKYVTQLTDFINNNKDFKFLDISTSYNYQVGDTFSLSVDNSRNTTNNNMGATIIDGILQAGLNYQNVVKPRVDKFKNEHRDIKTTSQFYELISNNDLPELIKMKGQKPERIHALVKFLKNEKVETEDDFYTWLENSNNLLRLSNIKGIKSKTIDYLKILTGHKETVAIDTRLINFIKLCCPELENVSYEFGHNLLMKTSKKLNIEAATLDFSIWSYMTNHKLTKI